MRRLPLLYPSNLKIWNLGRAKAPAIRLPKSNPYYNMGSISEDRIPGLWRSRNPKFSGYLGILAISLMFLVTACKVGPNYYPPQDVMPPEFAEDQPDKTFYPLDENLLDWWTAFNDPFLDQLLEETIRGNFDFQIALSKVYQARSQYWIVFTQILPEIDLSGTATHFRTSQNFANAANAANAASASGIAPISPIQNLFQLGFDAIWEIDLFGKLRRNADSYFDVWQATDETARDIKITVLSEVAKTYTLICSYQKKVEIANQSVQSDEWLLELSNMRFETGLANQQETLAAIGTLDINKANLIALQTLLRQTIYSLAVLLGRQPETLLCEFEMDRPIPYAAGLVPAGLPGDLLRRRHDIRSAERQLAGATEQIGVAVASLYPSVSLTGSGSSFAANPLQGANIGYASDTASKLFSSPSRIWGIGGFVTWPVIDFGKRSSGVDVQIYLQQQYYYNYQKTVITALQEVEQALVAYFNEERRMHILEEAAKASKTSFELATDLFQSGLQNYTQVLQAKNEWLTAQNSLTDSQQALATDLIAVYKALGGDW